MEFLDDIFEDDLMTEERADLHRKSKDDAAKINDTAEDLLNDTRYTDLITYSNLFAGQYDIESKLVSKLLDYTEKFMTALDYDVAVDGKLWKLVRNFKEHGKVPPVVNQQQADKIIEKSDRLHRDFPNNRYFSSHTFRAVNYSQASRLLHDIHIIIKKNGVTVGQYKEFHTEYHDYLNE